MKNTDIPQDPSPLDNFTKEVCYAVDDSGKYVTGLSRGWQVKADALGISWEEAQERVEAAKAQISMDKASPILYFMELNLMDLSIVAAYTGFWKWTVKRHLKPSVFRKLSESKIAKYAEVFEVTVNDIKNLDLNGA